MLAATDLQPQPYRAGQQHQMTAVLVTQVHVPAAARAILPKRPQDLLPIRTRRADILAISRLHEPPMTAPSTRHGSYLCQPRFFSAGLRLDNGPRQSARV